MVGIGLKIKINEGVNFNKKVTKIVDALQQKQQM